MVGYKGKTINHHRVITNVPLYHFKSLTHYNRLVDEHVLFNIKLIIIIVLILLI